MSPKKWIEATNAIKDNLIPPELTPAKAVSRSKKKKKYMVILKLLEIIKVHSAAFQTNCGREAVHRQKMVAFSYNSVILWINVNVCHLSYDRVIRSTTCNFATCYTGGI